RCSALRPGGAESRGHRRSGHSTLTSIETIRPPSRTPAIDRLPPPPPANTSAPYVYPGRRGSEQPAVAAWRYPCPPKPQRASNAGRLARWQSGLSRWFLAPGHGKSRFLAECRDGVPESGAARGGL